MKEKEKWTPPETALIYEQSMRNEIANRSKIPMSPGDLKVFDKIYDDMFRKLVASDNSKDTTRLKRDTDVLSRVRSYFTPIND